MRAYRVLAGEDYPATIVAEDSEDAKGIFLALMGKLIREDIHSVTDITDSKGLEFVKRSLDRTSIKGLLGFSIPSKTWYITDYITKEKYFL